MNDQKIKLIILLILIIIFSAISLFSKDIKDKIVARVNGKAITEKGLKEKMNSTINQIYFHKNLPPEKAKEIKKQSLGALIEEELLYQEAIKQKIKIDKQEINNQLAKIAQRYNSKSEFKKALKKQGYTLRDLKKKIEREYLIKEVYKRNILEKIVLTEKDLQDYYFKNKEHFLRPGAVNLQHILIKVKDPTSDSSWQEAYQKAQDLARRLNSGEDFFTLASLYSDDMYRIKGGNLGWVHRGRLLPEIEKIAFSLKKGEMSNPIRATYGYHIIKLLDKKDSQQLEFTEVKDKLKKDLEKKYEAEAKEKWIVRLKAQAEIKIYE